MKRIVLTCFLAGLAIGAWFIYDAQAAPATFSDWINTLTTSTADGTTYTREGSTGKKIAHDDANTASTLVRRDASGNFAAGTITAALTGTASGNAVLGSEQTFTAAQTFALEDAATTTVVYPIKCQRTTSGTAAAGLGCGIDWLAEDAGGNVESVGRTGFVLTDATAGSGDADWVVSCMAANAAPAECARVVGTGGIRVPNGATATPTLKFASGAGFFSQGNGPDVTFSNGASALFGFAVGGNSLGIVDGQCLAWNATLSGAYDTGLCRSADGVIRSSLGNTGDGWIQNSAGDKRITSDVTNATTTMSNLTDLSITLIAGRKYSCTAILYVADSVAADGVKFDFDGGTATMTSFRAHGTLFDTALLLSSQTTAIATDFAAATVTGDAMMEFHLGFVVNAAGTFIPRFAQNAHTTGTATAYTNGNILCSDTAN